MEKSIFRTVAVYAGMQLMGITLFLLSRKIDPLSIVFYDFSSLTVHVLLYLFLMHFKLDFFNLSTNKPLQKINLANRVTLLRISCLPTIAFLLRHKEIVEIKTVLLVLLILVFLTDSFDGQIARRKKQLTKMGQMLDSISDYSLLAVISVAYYRFNLLPHWFFYLIFFRLFLQSCGMLVFILMKKPIDTKSTWGGKITVAATMTLYVAELVRLYLPGRFDILFQGFEYFTGAVIMLLYFEKGLIFFRHGKKLKKNQAQTETPKGMTCNPERY